MLHTDASMSGWGAALNSETPAAGFWSAKQRESHITLLELKAVRLAVESFLTDLRGREVLHFIDNQAALAALTNVTSRSPVMMAELRKLWWVLDVNDVRMRSR